MEFQALNNGVQMPMEGYGVFQITDAAQCEQCASDALPLGYRLVDAALACGNEEPVGIVNVTFELDCRNNWHIHHGAGQILLCTAGELVPPMWLLPFPAREPPASG